MSDTEIIEGWVNETPSGTPISMINDEKDIKDWVKSIQKNMNIDISFEKFKQTYEEEFASVKYYKDVVQYARSLKNKCNIAILSNLMAFDQKRIDAEYNLSKFDKVYLSFEIGLRKPNKEIYEYVQKNLKINPKNILFIDDQGNNILTVKECGWNTCQAYGYELDKIKMAVQQFLEK